MASPELVTRREFFRDLSPREIYDVLVDFPAYPRLFKEMKSVTVREDAPPRKRVEFRADVVLSVRYVLDLMCDPAAFSLDWTFVEGEIISDSRGSWRLTGEGTGTWVEYKADLVLDAPLPKFIVKKATDALVSLSLPAMFGAIDKEARARKKPAATS